MDAFDRADAVVQLCSTWLELVGFIVVPGLVWLAYMVLRKRKKS